MSLTDVVCELCLEMVGNESRSAATKFWLGRGQIPVLQAHLPPNSDFSLDFGHFILKILKNLKILVSCSDKYR